MNSICHNLYFPIVIYLFRKFVDFFVTEKDHFYLHNWSGDRDSGVCWLSDVGNVGEYQRQSRQKKKGEKLSSYYVPATLTAFLLNL